MRYRRRPTYREAEQFGGFYATPYPPGVEMEDNSNDPERKQQYGRYAFYVVTAHKQRVYIEPGDYIVREPDGNGYYPCKAEVFERDHEPDEGSA